MATANGRGTKLEVGLTFASATNVTGLTLANPGVATSTAHGLANGAVGFWTIAAGTVQLEGQATRVYNQSANAFDLQGLDTTTYSTWSGTQTFTTVATWGTLTEMIQFQIGGGAADQLDDTKLNDIVKQIVFGTLPAQVVTINTLGQTSDGTAMAFIKSKAIASAYAVFRITLDGGNVFVFRGVPSLPGFDLSRSQLATGSMQIASKGLVLGPLAA